MYMYDLTLRYTGYFWSFRHNSCSSDTIEIFKHFFGPDHRVVSFLLKSFGLVWTSMNTYCLEFQENIECNFPLIGGQDYYLYIYQVSSISNKIVFQIFDSMKCDYTLKLDIKQIKNKKTDKLILIEPHLNDWHV